MTRSFALTTGPFSGIEEPSEHTTVRLVAVEHYPHAYRSYYWPADSFGYLKLEVFHLLASEGASTARTSLLSQVEQTLEKERQTVPNLPDDGWLGQKVMRMS